MLTVRNVCLNHVVLLGLTNIFQLVSFSAAEKGGDEEGPGGRSKLSSPSVRHVFFMSAPLFFLILLAFLMAACLFFASFRIRETSGIGNERGEMRGVPLLIPHFHSLTPVHQGPLPLQSYTEANR